MTTFLKGDVILSTTKDLDPYRRRTFWSIAMMSRDLLSFSRSSGAFL
ncbi:MAG: hypothetical protein ACTSXJ_09405 [Candidatus Baldrarchaeia archaeon]